MSWKSILTLQGSIHCEMWRVAFHFQPRPAWQTKYGKKARDVSSGWVFRDDAFHWHTALGRGGWNWRSWILMVAVGIGQQIIKWSIAWVWIKGKLWIGWLDDLWIGNAVWWALSRLCGRCRLAWPRAQAYVGWKRYLAFGAFNCHHKGDHKSSRSPPPSVS